MTNSWVNFICVDNFKLQSFLCKSERVEIKGKHSTKRIIFILTYVLRDNIVMNK